MRSLRHLRTRLRPTIRFKLTLWYGAMFLVCGALLVSLTYVLVRSGFEPSQRRVREIVAQRLDVPPRQFEPGAGQQPLFGTQFGQAQTGRPTLPQVIQQIQDEQMQQQLNSLLAWSLVALGIMAVLSLGLGWIVAGRLLRPVHELTALARRLSESTLHERIRLQRPRDELKELADTFDDMLERLDRAFTGQKEFVANASHELRTPLTIIRTELDVAQIDPDLPPEELAAMTAAVRDALERSEEVIDSLLLLAQSDRPADLAIVDLADLAQGSIERFASEADAMALQGEFALRAAWLEGDRILLERMIDNLIDNAIRHNEREGWFSVETAERDGRAVLAVANGGPAVLQAEAQRLFERFYRTDTSRSRRTGGSGLGLSIVKAVAEAHRGIVQALPLKDGGLEIRVSLPASSPASRPRPAA